MRLAKFREERLARVRACEVLLHSSYVQKCSRCSVIICEGRIWTVVIAEGEGPKNSLCTERSSCLIGKETVVSGMSVVIPLLKANVLKVSRNIFTVDCHNGGSSEAGATVAGREISCVNDSNSYMLRRACFFAIIIDFRRLLAIRADRNQCCTPLETKDCTDIRASYNLIVTHLDD